MNLRHFLSILATAFLSACATGGSGTSPAAVSVLRQAASLRQPSGGMLTVSETGWKRKITTPSGEVGLVLSESPASGTVTFPNGKSHKLPHMDETFASPAELPVVMAWMNGDGALVIQIDAWYTMESSQGIYSFQHETPGNYLTRSATSQSGGGQKIIRTLRSGDGAVLATSTDLTPGVSNGIPMGPQDFSKDW